MIIYELISRMGRHTWYNTETSCFCSLLILFPKLPSPLSHPLSAIFEVHHHDQFLLVLHIDRRYGDVSYNAELSTVVQMLVLQTEKVPNKPSEDFSNLLHTANKLVGDASRLFENEPNHPEKSEDDVFGHGKIVEDGAWINCFLPEQRILSSIGSKESPIHLEVPGQGIKGGDCLGEQVKAVEDLSSDTSQ